MSRPPRKDPPPPYRPDLREFEADDAAVAKGCLLYALLEGVGCAVFGCLGSALALALIAAGGGAAVSRWRDEGS